MPAQSELGRWVRGLTLAGAVTFGPTVACAQEPSGPPPSRLPQTNSRELPTVRPQPSPTPELFTKTENPPGSIWAIKIADNPYARNETSRLYSESGIYVKDMLGHIVGLDKNQKVFWRSSSPGTPVAATADRVVALMQQDNFLHLFDPQQNRDIATLPSEYPIPKEKMPDQYKTEPRFADNLLIVPHKETLTGTYDGFVIFDKNTGLKLWSTPRNAHYKLLDVTAETVLAGSGENLHIFESSSGSLLAQIPTDKRPNSPDREGWIFAKSGEFLFTVTNHNFDNSKTVGAYSREPVNRGIASFITAHNLRGQELDSVTINPGWHDSIFQRPGSFVCVQYCKPTTGLDVVPFATPKGLVHYVNAKISLDSQNKGGAPYGYIYLEFSYNNSFEWYPGYMKIFQSEVKQGTAGSGTFAYVYRDRKYTQAQDFTFPQQQEDPGRNNKSFMLIDESSTMFYDVPGIKSAGESNGFLLFTSWDNETLKTEPGNAILSGINFADKTGNSTWKRDLGGRIPHLVIKEGIIFVFTDSFLKVDPQTGNPEFKGAIPGTIKRVVDLGDKALVETEDGKLITYSLT